MRYSVGFGPFRFYSGGRRRRRVAPASKPGSAGDIAGFFVGLAVIALIVGVLAASVWVGAAVFVVVGLLVAAVQLSQPR